MYSDTLYSSVVYLILFIPFHPFCSVPSPFILFQLKMLMSLFMAHKQVKHSMKKPGLGCIWPTFVWTSIFNPVWDQSSVVSHGSSCNKAWKIISVARFFHEKGGALLFHVGVRGTSYGLSDTGRDWGTRCDDRIRKMWLQRIPPAVADFEDGGRGSEVRNGDGL